jgi:hypothetical protein
MYVTETSPLLRNVLAVASYPLITDPAKPQIHIVQPVDWRTPSATRTEALAQSTFIAFVPVKEDVRRTAILAHNDIPNFQAETLLMNAWLSSLTEVDGVAPVSETRVRIIRITDHTLFDAALARVVAAHRWPASYYAANPQRWWSEDDLAATDVDVRDAAFHSGDATVQVRAAAVEKLANGTIQLRFWVNGGTGGGWRIFVHLLNDAGDIAANAEAPLLASAAPDASKPIRLYTVSYATPPKNAAAVAFGVLRAATEIMTTDSKPSDWDNRRLILPLPASR